MRFLLIQFLLTILFACISISQNIERFKPTNCATANRTIAQNGTPSCYCDSKCPIYGDCCYSAPFPKENKSQPALRCSQFSNGMYYVKSVCANESFKDKCAKSPIYTVRKGKIRLKLGPVTAPSTGMTYANKYCAKCDNVSATANLTSWSTLDLITCTGNISSLLKFNRSALIFYSPTRPELLIKIYWSKNMTFLNGTSVRWGVQIGGHRENCTLQLAVPDSLKQTVRPCFPNIINDCHPANSSNTTRCKQFQSIVRSVRTGQLYRNKFCAACSGESKIEVLDNWANVTRATNVTGLEFQSTSSPAVLPNSTAINLTHITADATEPTKPVLPTIQPVSTILKPVLLTTNPVLTTPEPVATATKPSPTKPSPTSLLTTASTKYRYANVPQFSVGRNSTRRSYLLLSFSGKCDDVIGRINATKISAEDVQYVTIKRTYVKNTTTVQHNEWQTCQISNSSATPAAPQMPAILHVAFNVLLSASSVFLLLSLRHFLASWPSSNHQHRCIMIFYVTAMLLSNGGWFFKNCSNTSREEFFSPFGAVVNYFTFLASLACVAALNFHLSSTSWRAFYHFDAVESDAADSKNLYVYSTFIWFFPAVAALLANSWGASLSDSSAPSSGQHLLIFLVFPFTVLLSMNLAFYGHSVFIIWAGNEQFPKKLVNIGLNFGFHSTLVGVTYVMWFVAVLINYCDSYLLILSFYTLNLSACLLLYFTVCVRHIFAAETVSFFSRRSSSIIINDNE